MAMSMLLEQLAAQPSPAPAANWPFPWEARPNAPAPASTRRAPHDARVVHARGRSSHLWSRCSQWKAAWSRRIAATWSVSSPKKKMISAATSRNNAPTDRPRPLAR